MIASAPANVYARIKRIEDRVLELEKVATVQQLLRFLKPDALEQLINAFDEKDREEARKKLAETDQTKVELKVEVKQDPKELDDRITKLKEILQQKSDLKRKRNAGE